jgi:hypothetical protein
MKCFFASLLLVGLWELWKAGSCLDMHCTGVFYAGAVLHGLSYAFLILDNDVLRCVATTFVVEFHMQLLQITAQKIFSFTSDRDKMLFRHKSVARVPYCLQQTTTRVLESYDSVVWTCFQFTFTQGIQASCQDDVQFLFRGDVRPNVFSGGGYGAASRCKQSSVCHMFT